MDRRPIAHVFRLKRISAVRGQPRINLFHHPEKLLEQDDDGDVP
jgi:hypothetical protein